MAKNKRVKIPSEIENRILYDSAYTCNVCREKQSIQIHHIDENPNNNIPGNLILLCSNCHDKAHTIHKLSKNLTPEKLLFCKNEWEAHIANISASSMMSRNNVGILNNAIWTFINHEKISQLTDRLKIGFDTSVLDMLYKRGSTDKFGIPIIKKKSQDRELVTIYNHLDYGDMHRFHKMYCDAVDTIISNIKPIEIGAIWSKKEIKDLIKPGSFIFTSRGFYFKSGKIINNEEDRLVYGRAKNIELRWYANTRHMFGTSSLYCTFKGHKHITAFLIVKSVSVESNLLIIDCTPLSMGVGFLQRYTNSPYKSKIYSSTLYDV